MPVCIITSFDFKMIVLLVLNDLVDYKMFEYLFRDKDFKKNVS